MKKHTRKITSILLGMTTVSSIALSLHFDSLKEDLEHSHNELNAKYKEVLVENEELQNTIIKLDGDLKKSSGLLEQSQLEIDRLNNEEIPKLKEQIVELEKKLKSTP